jgi:hypothetical protein
MTKILFTFGQDKKEGFDSIVPLTTKDFAAESVEAIEGPNVIEKVKDLPAFIDECYRLLKFGGTCTFTAPHYGSSNAWISPLTVRGISEATLNFASKAWREQTKFSDVTMLCDFEVFGNFAIEADYMNRSGASCIVNFDKKMIVEVLRIGLATMGPQFGIIRVNGFFCCLSFERPWLDNAHNVSSIPVGEYKCKRVTNRVTHGGMAIPVTYEVQIETRSGILFHVGNSLRDTDGCILVGLGTEFTGAWPIITNSAQGFHRFLERTRDEDEIDLDIKVV